MFRDMGRHWLLLTGTCHTPWPETTVTLSFFWQERCLNLIFILGEYLTFGGKKQGVVYLPREKSQSQPTLPFRVTWWTLLSAQVSSKLERWHVSPLLCPLANLVLTATFRKIHAIDFLNKQLLCFAFENCCMMYLSQVPNKYDTYTEPTSAIYDYLKLEPKRWKNQTYIKF